MTGPEWEGCDVPLDGLQVRAPGVREGDRRRHAPFDERRRTGRVVYVSRNEFVRREPHGSRGTPRVAVALHGPATDARDRGSRRFGTALEHDRGASLPGL